MMKQSNPAIPIKERIFHRLRENPVKAEGEISLRSSTLERVNWLGRGEWRTLRVNEVSFLFIKEEIRVVPRI